MSNNGWMPIDTAPKDGTKFIGWVDEDWIEGFYYDGNHFWFTSDGDGPGSGRLPKYWMPWPTSPARMNNIHTCSYSCDRPECIKAQRDELAAAAAQEAVAWQRRWADADGLWFNISKEIYEATQNGKWADRYEVRALYAAPSPQRRPE